MKKLKILKLSRDFRYLQKLALKLVIKILLMMPVMQVPLKFENVSYFGAYSAIIIDIRRSSCLLSKPAILMTCRPAKGMIKI